MLDAESTIDTNEDEGFLTVEEHEVINDPDLEMEDVESNTQSNAEVEKGNEHGKPNPDSNPNWGVIENQQPAIGQDADKEDVPMKDV